MPVVCDLPSELLQEIGQITVSFAHLEYLLSRVIWFLLNVGPKQGRLAIREPKATDRFEVICDLLALWKIEPATNTDLLLKALDEVQRERNAIAHGIWLQDGERLLVQKLMGQWQPVKHMRGKVKRKVDPEGCEYGVGELRKLNGLLNETIVMIRRLASEIEEAVETLRGTPRTLAHTPSRHQDESP